MPRKFLPAPLGGFHNWRGTTVSGNGLSGWSLHDFMASLPGKPNPGTLAYSPKVTGYWPNGEWQVYKYYNLDMTGHREGTSTSADTHLDTYATIGSIQVKIL